MENPSLYNLIITSTLSNKEFHSILLLTEYFLSIFPYVSSSVNKIRKYGQEFEYSAVERSLILFSGSKRITLLNSSTPPYFWYFDLVAIGVGIVLNCCYFLTLKLYKPTTKRNIFIIILINILGLFFYRYLSFFFIDSLWSSFYYFYFQKGYNTYRIFCLINIFIQIFFYFSALHFISTYSFYCRIKNQLIYKDKIEYPFDCFSKTYEQIFLLFKIIIGNAANYLSYQSNIPSFLTIVLDIILIFYSVLIFTLIFIEKTRSKEMLFLQLKGNLELNFIRKFIITFNLITICQHFIFRPKDTYLEISNLLINCFVSAMFIAFNWKFLEIKKIRQSLKENNLSIVITLLSNNLQVTEADFKKITKSWSPLKKFEMSFIKLLEKILAQYKMNYILTSKEKKTTDEKEEVPENALVYYQIMEIMKQKPSMKYLPPEQKAEIIFAKFLYSYITQNNYETNKYYYKLRFLSNKSFPLKNATIFIFEQTLNELTTLSNFYIQQIITLCQITLRTEKVLSDFLEFINEGVETKTCLLLLKISREVYHQKKDLARVLKRTDLQCQMINSKSLNEKSKANSQCQNTKTIQSVYKYNGLVLRYILESLTNEPCANLPRLNIEGYEDFLHLHFQSDNLIILSNNILEEGNISFEIIKVSGMGKCHHKYLSGLFPSEIQNEGSKKLLHSLDEPQPENGYTFEFLINNKGYYEHFHLNFSLTHSLIKNSITIFGFFTKNHKKTVLLKCGKDNILFQGVSKSATQILGLNPVMVNVLQQNCKNFLGFTNFFETLDFVPDEKSKSVTNNIFSQILKIRCVISYSKLAKTVVPLLEKEIKERKEYNSSQEIQHNFLQMKKEFETKKRKKATIVFEKLFTVNEFYCYFKCGTLDDTAKTRISEHRYDLSTIKAIEKDIYSKEESEHENRNMKFLLSTASMTDHSASSRSSIGATSIKGKKETTFEVPIIKKELKKTSLVSIVIVILNSSLFVLCFVFLVLQINQTSLISNTSRLTIVYKTLRHSFINVFFSTMSLVCIEENIEYSRPCSNPFVKLATNYQNEINFTDYHMIQFFWYDMTYKIKELKEYHYELKSLVLQNKVFERFLFLLDYRIRYNYLEQQDEKLVQIIDEISFDEGIERTINSELSLVNGEDASKLIHVPYYILNVTNGVYALSDLKQQTFTGTQHQIFRIMSNYANYYNSFEKGRIDVAEFFKITKSKGLVNSIIFMVIFVILNGFILFINLKHLEFSQTLFQKLMAYSIFQISEKDFKEFLLKKIENLIDLSALYARDPNETIQTNSQNETIYLRRLKNQQNNIAQQTQVQIQEKKKKDLENFIQGYHPYSFPMKDFTLTAIRPIKIKNILLFFFYLIVIVIADVILIILMLDFYSFRVYVDLNYNLQTYIYTDMAFLHYFHLVNTTDKNLKNVFGGVESEDGMLNYFVRYTTSLYNEMLTSIKLSNYPKEEDYIAFDCDKMYAQAEDKILISFHSSYDLTDGDKMYKLPKMVCKNLQFEKLGLSLFEDYFVLLLNLNNRYLERDFKGIYSIFKDEMFFRTYLYLHFYFRPIKRNFDQKILKPMALQQIRSYQIYLWIYLILNIILEILIFAFYKLLVSKELNSIQKYLTVFVQCIKH